MPKEYEEDNTIDFDLDNHVHQEHQLSLQHLITLFYFGVWRTRTRNGLTGPMTGPMTGPINLQEKECTNRSSIDIDHIVTIV